MQVCTGEHWPALPSLDLLCFDAKQVAHNTWDGLREDAALDQGGWVTELSEEYFPTVLLMVFQLRYAHPVARIKLRSGHSQHNRLNCPSFVFFISFQVYTFLWWLYARDWGWWWWLGRWDGDHMWRQVLRMESLIRYECFYHPQFPGGWHSTNMQIVSPNAIYNLINELQLSH